MMAFEIIDQAPKGLKPLEQTNSNSQFQVIDKIPATKLVNLDVKPYEPEKSGVIGSFFKGWEKAFADTASGVNYLLEKGSEALGLDKAKDFFHKNREDWNANSNYIENTTNPTARFVGEIVNPALLMPIGAVSKGKLVYDVLANAGIGSIYGAGSTALREIGKDNISTKQKLEDIKNSALIGSVGGGVLGGIFSKLFSKTPEKIANDKDIPAEEVLNNIKNIIKEKNAEKYTPNFILVDSVDTNKLVPINEKNLPVLRGNDLPVLRGNNLPDTYSERIVNFPDIVKPQLEDFENRMTLSNGIKLYEVNKEDVSKMLTNINELFKSHPNIANEILNHLENGTPLSKELEPVASDLKKIGWRLYDPNADKIANEWKNMRGGFLDLITPFRELDKAQDATNELKNIADYYYGDKKGWRNISDGIMGDIRRLFTDTRSGEYKNAYSEFTAMRNADNDYIDNIRRALSEAPDNIKQDLVDYIEGVKKDYDPSVIELGKTIQDEIKRLQDEMKEAGFSPDIVDKYGINYVARLYSSKLGGTQTKDALRAIKNKIEMKIYSPKKLRGYEQVMTKDEFQKKVANGEIPEELIGKPKKDGGYDVYDLGDGRVKVVRDWTPEERAEMGQIKDPDVVIPLTLMRLSQMKNLKNFYEKVRNIDGASLTEKYLIDEFQKLNKREPTKKELEDFASQKGYEKLGNDYGALSNTFVRKDVADDIKYLRNKFFNDNELNRAYQKYLSMWKKSKTIYNATAHVNNFLSNTFLSLMVDSNPFRFLRDIGSSVKDLRNLNKLQDLLYKEKVNRLTPQEAQELGRLKQNMKYVEEAKKYGLLDTSMLKDFETTAGMDNQLSSAEYAKGILGKTAKKITDLYQNEDNLFKLAWYKKLRQKGYKPQDAINMVKIFFPDYTEPLPKGWSFFRETGIAPFISWSYYVLPKIIKTMNPVKNPKMALKVFGLMALLEYLQYKVSNGEINFGADFNPFDNSKPDNFKSSRFVYKKDGRYMRTFKVDRFIPHLSFLSLLGSPSASNSFIKQTFGGIPVTALSALGGEKYYYGTPITYPNRTLPRRIYDNVKYGVESFVPLPAQLYSIWDTFIDKKVKDKLDKTHRKRPQSIYVDRTPEENILKLLGINTLSYDQQIFRKKRHK